MAERERAMQGRACIFYALYRYIGAKERESYVTISYFDISAALSSDWPTCSTTTFWLAGTPRMMKWQPIGTTPPSPLSQADLNSGPGSMPYGLQQSVAGLGDAFAQAKPRQAGHTCEALDNFFSNRRWVGPPLSQLTRLLLQNMPYTNFQVICPGMVGAVFNPFATVVVHCTDS